MSGSISDQDIPTSFGTFKPVGHLMLGLPNLAGSHAVFAALREAGWPAEDMAIITSSMMERVSSALRIWGEEDAVSLRF
jgi:hypothetical protein